MLVLTVRAGERLFIEGGRIKVQVVEVRGQNVILGVEAPREVVVDREKIHRRREAEEFKDPRLAGESWADCCRRTHFQYCNGCEDVGCGDNTNPMLSAQRDAAKAERA